MGQILVADLIPDPEVMAVPAASGATTTGCEQMQQEPRLFDHLVGAREQHGGNGEAERPGGVEVDD